MQASFINKINTILQDPLNVDVICWNHNNTAIFIRNQTVFQQKILPKYFRHRHMSSFVRQLNYYGFRKQKCASNLTYSHQLLKQGFSLNLIKNKRSKIGSSQQIHSNGLQFMNNQKNLQRQAIKIEGSAKIQHQLEHRIQQNILMKEENNRKEQTISIFDKSNININNQIRHTNINEHININEHTNINFQLNQNHNPIPITNINAKQFLLIPILNSSQQQQLYNYPFTTPRTQQLQFYIDFNCYVKWS